MSIARMLARSTGRVEQLREARKWWVISTSLNLDIAPRDPGQSAPRLAIDHRGSMFPCIQCRFDPDLQELPCYVGSRPV